MDEEGANVAEDENERYALGLEAEDLVVGDEEVDHTAEDHVDEGVNPQRSEEDEEDLCGEEGFAELVLDAECAEDVAGCLPCATHDENPGKRLLVQDRLHDVGEGCEAEKADEEDCSAEGRAVVPLCLGVTNRVAFEVGHR